MIYVITTGTKGYDMEVDQVVEGKAQADREAKDLRSMGCKVTVKGFATWEEAEAYEDKVRGY